MMSQSKTGESILATVDNDLVVTVEIGTID